MEITLEYLQNNLESVRQRLERAKNDVLMYDGAAQALENMITYFNEPKAELNGEATKEALEMCQS